MDFKGLSLNCIRVGTHKNLLLLSPATKTQASMGGGGKGMRVVRKMEDLASMFQAASSEALASFGDGSVFIERFVDRPRHIEVQIIGDGTGNVVHLWERDCSVQRRHQKVIEMAPAWTLPDDLRAQLHEYAIRLTSAANYKNAGTVEFLIDAQMRPYFIEVNPRIQVEHTVTEEVTGIDIVQAQLRIAAGGTLESVGLIQENISPRYVIWTGFVLNGCDKCAIKQNATLVETHFF
jgi:pyruvate carboxylase